ncbi:MAG: excinuclease ABC subunit UvrA [Verrucomicrobia bacterium]|nr:excinuclease ABC subunit UvrA [Verrucomicrobiota bacterium]
MQKKSAPKFIRLRGVRHNNLKNFDLDLPIGKLVVITGLSGSGKSSLAFDVLFAEGQRRYIETFSPYTRQFFDRMDKPQVDSIEGIPPAIAIEQRNAVKTTRSTVGTMTEICDYAKVLWAHLAQLHCRKCGRPVTKDSPQKIWETVSQGGAPNSAAHSEILITFKLPLSEKLPLTETLNLVAKQGYQRLLVEGEIKRLEEATAQLSALKAVVLTVVQDRIKIAPTNRHRFIEACEQAYHFGKGKLTLHFSEAGHSKAGTRTQTFSNRLHCAECDIDYREPVPALFSFNHPLGACPTCRGFGRVITIDYNLAIPDRSKTLAGGVVKPWQTGQSAECQDDMMKFCRKRHIPTNVPFRDLPNEFQDWVINGEPNYGMDDNHQWPKAWYGIKGYFRWLESKSYKMHVRVLLSRYRSYRPCDDCHGARFQPDTLLYKVVETPRLSESSGKRRPAKLSLSDFYQLSLRDSLQFIESLAAGRKHTRTSDPLTLALHEVRARLSFMNEVGLGYLTLDRPTRTLSGGETERVSLTTCLGSGLVNTLFVLDEPSVGLHPRDTDRLIEILQRLRDVGNTVVVVEHEANVMRAADEIIDLGPGHGETGGQIVFQGRYRDILKAKGSLTGEYLSGRKAIEVPERRKAGQASCLSQNGKRARSARNVDNRSLVSRDASAPRDRQDACPALKITGATAHNLCNVTVEIPLGRFVCITGVSGSGKSTLVRDVLLPALEERINAQAPSEIETTEDDSANDGDEKSALRAPHSEVDLRGFESIGRVLLVDQTAIGRTPRSNPAVYIGAFDDIREIFAQTEVAKQRGLNASAFSFNSSQGQCERCRGAGFEKIEMQFLSDVFIRCPDCDGRRYRSHILEIKVDGSVPGSSLRNSRMESVQWNIADLLEASADQVIHFLQSLTQSRHAQHAIRALQLLQEVGLGYLRLGQPINTLSGGESQRLKLVSHLAEFGRQQSSGKPTMFFFDEPTTGLHFDDVRVLTAAFHKLVEAGNSVVVIEHNLELIKCADWLIDLGPEAGDRGGEIVAVGTPEEVLLQEGSHTGRALRQVLS